MAAECQSFLDNVVAHFRRDDGSCPITSDIALEPNVGFRGTSDIVRSSPKTGSVANDPLYGPAVRCRVFVEIAVSGLALMYPAFDWSGCSGPSWISARVRSHYRTGLNRARWVTSVRMRREDRPPSRLILSQTSAGKSYRSGYVIGRSSYCAVLMIVA